jgi:hypothetical protein
MERGAMQKLGLSLLRRRPPFSEVVIVLPLGFVLCKTLCDNHGEFDGNKLSY